MNPNKEAHILNRSSIRYGDFAIVVAHINGRKLHLQNKDHSEREWLTNKTELVNQLKSALHGISKIQILQYNW